MEVLNEIDNGNIHFSKGKSHSNAIPAKLRLVFYWKTNSWIIIGFIYIIIIINYYMMR